MPLQHVVFLEPQLIFIYFISEDILGLRATEKVNIRSLNTTQYNTILLGKIKHCSLKAESTIPGWNPKSYSKCLREGPSGFRDK